jgi:protein transport protein SEC13
MAQTAPSAAMNQEVSNGPILVDTQHEDLVHDAQLDYYGCKLATSSSDRTIKIYNVSEDSSELSATLQGHEGPVWQVSWAHPKFGGTNVINIIAFCMDSISMHPLNDQCDRIILFCLKHFECVNKSQNCTHNRSTLCFNFYV